MPCILAIETSCDETAVAVVEGDAKPHVLVNEVSSQIPLHQLTGGVVPEVAAREQAVAMLPVLEEALKKSGKQPADFDAIAYTREPGLIGSLLVGRETAETLAVLWKKPILPLNHMQAHIYGAFAELDPKEVKWPAIVLVVSGGHTELWLMESHLQFEILGATQDDAAGEAFDKIARLLGLSYPGGPSIARLAATIADANLPLIEPLPRPMLAEKSDDFSFSGLKTAMLYRVRDRQLDHIARAQLAAEAQQAVVDVLVGKTLRAAERANAQTIVLAGGVAANQLLRATLQQSASSQKIDFLCPDFLLCTDNAAMVGVLGWYTVQK